MATELRLRRGTTAQHAAFTGASSEVTVDSDKKTLVVHDGITAGGVPLSKEADLTAHKNRTDNPHGTTKADLGLGNVDNVSAASLRDRATHTGTQPISSVTALQGALDAKVIAASGPGGSAYSFRNKIINGDFSIWQRGISFTTTGISYCADRWCSYQTGVACNIQRNPSGSSDKYEVTVVGAAGNTAVNIGQRIEAANAHSLAGKTVTIQARVYSTVVASVQIGASVPVAADNFNSGWVDVQISPAIPLIASWNDVTFTLTVPASATNGLLVEFVFGAVGADTARGLGSVQIEEGPIATPFERRPIGLELALCQRYYEKLPARYWNHTTQAAASHGHTIPFAVSKRALPTVTLTDSTLSNFSNLRIEQPSAEKADLLGEATAAGLLFYATTLLIDAEL